MRKMLAVVVVVAGLGVSGSVAADPDALHPVNTYSIICYDSVTGQFGAAVQSHWFKVADVIWLEPGVGAVATQSLVEFSYGPLGLEMMRNGKSAEQALAGLLASDSNRAVRQVAIIDANSRVAVHTGDRCIAEAGHRAGTNYSVQANLMRNNTVWDAMAGAFERTDGDLAERMMAALEAAEAEGGDIRGRQSAAMVVVAGSPSGRRWRDRLVDIRVDDSPRPLVELRRLLDLTRAYDKMNEGDGLLAQRKFDEAAAVYRDASKLAPGNMEILFWYAVTLVSVGEVDRSLPVFKGIFQEDDSWRTLVPRLVKSELLPDNPETIQKIVNQ